MALKDEIEEETRILETSARQNYMALYFLSIAAIIASFFAGLSVALAWFGKDILAVLSSLPAGVLICSDRLKLEDKANWYWTKYYALHAVLSGIKYEGLSESEASKACSKINQEHETKWPGFGAPPKK